MDEFLDQFLSSSPWSDVKAPERLSWIGNGPDHTNGLLLHTMGAYGEDEENMAQSLIPPSQTVDNLTTQKISDFAVEHSSFDPEKSLCSGESKQWQGAAGHGNKPSLQLGVLDGNSKPSYMDIRSNTSSTLGALNHDQPEIIPVVVDPSNSSSVQPESGSVGSNDSELSEIQPLLIHSHCLSSVPQLWPPSYRGASSLFPVVEQDKLQGFCLQRHVETDAAVLGNKYFSDTILQGNMPPSLPEQNGMNNHYLRSFASGHQIPLGRTAEIHSQMQLSHLMGGNSMKHYADQSPISNIPRTPTTASGDCNGAAKHRVRARRGQATDPHSIAERLRRENIAERMKNLQELVPNSNKTDKASMLDEIIEYVKFLQLQVKVLSMSRLGAAGAVVPLITHSRTEGSTGFLLSQSTGRVVIPFESTDDLAFEEEVVKLMESDMTTAMQFLQNKGLCFMPIALAAAISGSKAPSSSISADEKESILTNGVVVHHNNGQPSVVTGQICSDGENGLKDGMNGICSTGDIPAKGCDVSMTKKEGINSMLPIQDET